MAFPRQAILIIILTLASIERLEGSKILLYPFGHCVNSHLLNMEKLAAMLLDKGHEVTMLIHSKYDNSHSFVDLSRLQYIYFAPPENVSIVCGFSSIGEYLETPLSVIVSRFYSSSLAFCEAIIKDDTVMGKLKSGGWQLGVYDVVDPCSRVLADYVDIPFIAFHTHGLDSVTGRHPAYLPSLLTTYSDQMTLPQRALNTVAFMAHQLIAIALVRTYEQLKAKYNLNSTLSLRETYNRASLKFVLGNHALDYVGPLPPSTIIVGGVIESPPQQMSTALQHFLDGADKNGVVLVSFGSLLRTYDSYWGELFARALARLPMRVVWKFNGTPPDGIGNNTMLIPWLPQVAVLCHRNLKVFVTHAGWNSAYESVACGVPVVAIPLFADQFFQSTKLTNRVGSGLQLNIRSLTEDALYNTIMRVDLVEEYRHNAKSTSEVIKDKPRAQHEEISYWVNYVIRHRGALHLKSQESSLTWHEFLLLDVLTLILAILSISLFVLYTIVRLIFWCIRTFFRRTKSNLN